MVKTKTIVISAVVMVGLLLTSPFLLNWYESSPRFWPSDHFDPTRWQHMPHPERYRVVNDLMKRHSPVGWTRTELESRLGAPDSEAPDKRFVTYELKDGDKERFTLNSVYVMRIWIDASGRVTEVNISAD